MILYNTIGMEKIFMLIDVKRCYFHSIQPLINFKNRKEIIEEIIDRLNLMLDYGYLVPGCELNDILPTEYQIPANASFCNDDSVYLAQHILTKLAPIGGSYFNGEFSAYLEHISASPSLVFSEFVTDNKKIEKRSHALSEEVCIQQRIPLNELIALALPYQTPLERLSYFISLYEEDDFFYSIMEDFLPSSRKELTPIVKNILNNPELEIEKQYAIIQKFKDCLISHNYNIPLIRYDGSEFIKEKEYVFIENNKEKILKLIREN